jgi:hypothetical protein
MILRLFALLASCALLGAMWIVPSSATAQQPPRNNIVGLNLGRYKDDKYIWATSDLANANGGDWGYVTTTWTREDRDHRMADYHLQQFLDRCYEFRVQPIIRVATTFDPKRKMWLGPEWDEPLKWRELFERAEWPVERVWIIAGNEPNLGREWSGEVDAEAYARYLARFMDVFKGSSRFQVVNAPLDISNGTQLPEMQDALEFMDGMRRAVPDIFERLPAWASNPYRVPSGGTSARYTHLAYEAELAHIGRDMPVLITEAHAQETQDDEEIAAFFEMAYRDWMRDPRVVAATPLFWHPDTGVYWMFSMDRAGGIKSTSPTYHRLRTLPRVSGSPGYRPPVGNVARVVADPTLEVVAAPPAGDMHRLSAVFPPPVRQAAEPVAVDAEAHVAAVPPPTLPRSPSLVANTFGRGAVLRATPGMDGEPLMTLPEGSTVEMYGIVVERDGLDWMLVSTIGGMEGWIAVPLLAAAGPRS